MARPVEYRPELVEKVREYLSTCVDTNKQLVKSVGAEGGTQYENKLEVKIPTIEGCAIFLEISRETMYAWERTYAEFSDILETLRQMQAERLLNKGLSGEYNPTIAKMMASRHGYVEKQAFDVTTNDDEPTDAELAAVIRRSTHGSEIASLSAAA